jgi:hypothetical protein
MYIKHSLHHLEQKSISIINLLVLLLLLTEYLFPDYLPLKLKYPSERVHIANNNTYYIYPDIRQGKFFSNYLKMEGCLIITHEVKS